MRRDGAFDRIGYDARTAQALEHGKVYYAGQRHAAPQRTHAAEGAVIAEREQQARDEHQYLSRDEGYGDRQQYGGYDSHGLARVDICRQIGQRSFVAAPYRRQGDGHSRAEQSEDQRYGSRGGQAERVEYVKKNDVAQHHAQKQSHDLLEGKLRRIEHAVARHLHHAARRHHAEQDAQRCHREYHAARSGLRAECRVEKVDRIVGYAHDDSENRQQAECD